MNKYEHSRLVSSNYLDHMRTTIPHRDHAQAALAALGMLLGLAIFIAIERMVTPRYSFVTWLDNAVPFIPLSWLAYVLFFPFIVVASAYAPVAEFKIFKSASLIAFIAASACFVLFPESVPRPDPASIDNGFLRQRFEHLWALDLALNGFPSLHVAITCLACRMLRRARYQWLSSVTGLLICLSTLTIKQHTVIDVGAGALLAVLCSLLCDRRQTTARSHGHA